MSHLAKRETMKRGCVREINGNIGGDLHQNDPNNWHKGAGWYRDDLGTQLEDERRITLMQ